MKVERKIAIASKIGKDNERFLANLKRLLEGSGT